MACRPPSGILAGKAQPAGDHGNSPAAAQDVLDVVRDMGHLQSAIARREMIANQPQLHHYELVPIPVLPRPNPMAGSK